MISSGLCGLFWIFCFLAILWPFLAQILGSEAEIWAKKGHKMAKKQNIQKSPHSPLDIIGLMISARFWGNRVTQCFSVRVPVEN
jgi:hypothetical protein